MRTARIATIVLLALAALGQQTSAQSLTISLFERYLAALRVEARIPGLSAAIVQNGQVVWASGFGHQDVDSLVRAEPDTPYPVLDLSQTMGATLLLQQCLDLRHLEITDQVRRWVPEYGEPDTTVAHLLAHAAPGGGFRYDPSRFATLTAVVAQCASAQFPRLVSEEVLDRLGMVDSVPGLDLLDPSSSNRRGFSSDRLARYEAIGRRLAVPYRIDGRGSAVRSEHAAQALTASTGLVSTVRDLARFDAALGDGGVLLQASTREMAWTPLGSMPTGLGWFVQSYNGERLVWHFGLAKDAYSSLVLKVPGRGLTLILLANSDGLSAPYALENGDVTASLFARLFLRLFVT